MRNLFIVTFIFFIFTSHSQNFLETLDGKVYNNASFLKFIGNDILFAYDSKKTRINIEEIKHSVFENVRIENLLLIGKSKSDSYCIIASTDDKRLVGKTINGSGTTNYFYYIIDSNNNILHTFKFTNGLSKSSIEERTFIENIIKEEFSDCINLLSSIDNCLPDKYLENKTISKSKKDKIENINLLIKEKSKKSKENIIYFFDKREYVSCNK